MASLFNFDEKKIVNYAYSKNSKSIAYYEPGDMLNENGVIKGVFVYSLSVNFKENSARLVFCKLSASQLNKIKNKFGSNCNSFINTIAKAMGFDVEIMPRIFNDKYIDFSQEKAQVRDSRSDSLEQEYIFDL